MQGGMLPIRAIHVLKNPIVPCIRSDGFVTVGSVGNIALTGWIMKRIRISLL